MDQGACTLCQHVCSTGKILSSTRRLKNIRGGYIITFPKQDTAEQSGITTQMLVAPTADSLRPAGGYNHPSFPLSAAQLLVLVEEFMFEISYITQNDIKDRSKADAFTKLFAIGQSGWLIVQCIARAAQGLRKSTENAVRKDANAVQPSPSSNWPPWASSATRWPCICCGGINPLTWNIPSRSSVPRRIRIR